MVAPGQRSGAAPRYHPTRAHATLERGRRLLPGARWLVVPIPSPMIACHADHVGSLLRPPALTTAREEAASGRISPTQFKAIEDRAVEDAVSLQERVGLPVVTDGEQRRLSFQGQFAESLSGLGDWDLNAFLWGDWRGDSSSVGDRSIARPAGLGVVEKLGRKRYSSVEEFVFLRARTTRLCKITLPSPSLWANFWSPERSRAAYPTLESFLADVVDLLREEVAELVRLGARYIQLDAPHYALLLDPATRGFYESRGGGTERYLERGIEMDNAVIGNLSGVTFGIHLCRGNQGSRWLANGGYGRIARTIFRRVRAQRLLLEYDDARSGSFAPLAEVPDDKLVVLGLVTTKRAHLEPMDELERRIREASRFVPLERLAVSPQCGFSSSVIGNAITPADQERKLKLIVETARRVWGEDRISEDR
jgi:5-methyltetrahydropteroyltriglutamate--homocysteine methyltransferase